MAFRSVVPAPTRRLARVILFAGLAATGVPAHAQVLPLYVKPEGVVTRWSSFENPAGAPGSGGATNKGAKGRAFEPVKPGETKTLLDTRGSGMVTRMWVTVNDRTTETLRSLRLDAFWDGADKPAVSVPLGDFFGALVDTPTTWSSELFSNPEARSFNCYIPMPFRRSARMTLTNESTKTLKLLFYDVDCLLGVRHPPGTLYFHAYWHRENPTTLGRDFEILPRVVGRGRFLGANIGVIADRRNLGWWGEGEVKVYLNGDERLPTLVGTGTEDYIGTGWGQKPYADRYQGCLVADDARGLYSFYRYHVPDPVYWDREGRVTIQQMGGDSKTNVIKMLKTGTPSIIPVTASHAGGVDCLLDLPQPVDLEKHPSPPNAWTNYFRRDDVCAVALFYLDRPQSNLPALAPVAERIAQSH